jgi:hypothetical protein
MRPRKELGDYSRVEEYVTDQIIVHPTRDDWHEQRERTQTFEGTLEAHRTTEIAWTSRRGRP